MLGERIGKGCREERSKEYAARAGLRLRQVERGDSMWVLECILNGGKFRED